jgi:hypothetical protein
MAQTAQIADGVTVNGDALNATAIRSPSEASATPVERSLTGTALR